MRWRWMAGKTFCRIFPNRTPYVHLALWAARVGTIFIDSRVLVVRIICPPIFIVRAIHNLFYS